MYVKYISKHPGHDTNNGCVAADMLHGALEADVDFTNINLYVNVQISYGKELQSHTKLTNIRTSTLKQSVAKISVSFNANDTPKIFTLGLHVVRKK